MKLDEMAARLAPVLAVVALLGGGCGKSNRAANGDQDAGAGAGGSVAGGGAGTGGSGPNAGSSGSTAGDPGDPGAAGAGVGGVGGDGAGGAGGWEPAPPGAPDGAVVVKGTRLCAGNACADDQVCCLLTGECVDADTASQECVEDATTVLPRQAGAPPDARRCNSNADCAASEYCENHLLCLGPGFCTSRTNCPTSTGLEFCGCDGLTYPNHQSACYAGTRVAGQGRCGELHVEGAAGGVPERSYTLCATQGDCGDGQMCCEITGQCIDAERSAICAQPPEGTYAACLDNSDCYFDDLCQGEGCGTLGGCVTVSQEDCTGLLEPVCGCDGQSYTSAGCAAVALTRVADTAACEAAAAN